MNTTQIYFVTLSVAFVALSINQILLWLQLKKLQRRVYLMNRRLFPQRQERPAENPFAGRPVSFRVGRKNPAPTAS